MTFWKENVEKQIPPKPEIELDTKFIQATLGKTIKATSTSVETYTELREIDEHIKNLTEKRNALATRIKLFMNDAEILVDGAGDPLITWRKYSQDRFDTKIFKEIDPETYNKFIKKIESRKLEA